MVLDGENPDNLLRIMMLGEVFSKAGRRAIASLVPQLRKECGLHLVIVNGESAAGGYGLTAATAEELLNNGIDVITTGSRVFDQREMVEWVRAHPEAPVVRPLNYPPGTPGRASYIAETACGPLEILNLNGKVYFNEMDSPFRVVDQWLEKRAQAERNIPLVVDFHAEATSEKVVLGWFLDGRVSAVLGTHTRTPTADARLLKHGTAHVSDVGMIGLYNSMAGMDVEAALKPFTAHYQPRHKSNKHTGGPVVFNSVIVEIDPTNGRAVSINRYDKLLDEELV
ncbi:MAG TPA: TIGR00282 family metallophosphoesterase [Chloroflexia bacterium]|nr:TIGR00282 family metallophosphoesterase [Chloroflexia bacterium]